VSTVNSRFINNNHIQIVIAESVQITNELIIPIYFRYQLQNMVNWKKTYEKNFRHIEKDYMLFKKNQ